MIFAKVEQIKKSILENRGIYKTKYLADSKQ